VKLQIFGQRIEIKEEEKKKIAREK